MLLSRNELVSALFCETDRAQRMNMPLAVIGIGTDCSERQSCSGDGAVSAAREEIVRRITRILRCYDSVGQMADGEFVLILPGCNLSNANTMAERLRDEVFGSPFETCDQQIHLNACFGVVSSAGRSPFVVLREARKALQRAQAKAPASIHCLGLADELDSGALPLPVVPDKSLHW